jgi:cell wall-associated NlpC family hydrolase
MSGRDHAMWFGLVLLVVAGVLATGCGSPVTARHAREQTGTPPTASGASLEGGTDLVSLANAAAQLPETRRQIVEVALAMTGAPAKRLDCSSFAQEVYGRSRLALPRTTRQQFAMGHEIAMSQLQSGDLIFFAFSKRPVDHVGIYTGNGSFVHVSSSTRTVRLESLSKAIFAKSLVAARRFVEP